MLAILLELRLLLLCIWWRRQFFSWMAGMRMSSLAIPTLTFMIDTVPCEVGSTKLHTRNTGANLLNVSYIPPPPSQTGLMNGDPSRLSKHVKLQLDAHCLTDLPPATTHLKMMIVNHMHKPPHNPPLPDRTARPPRHNNRLLLTLTKQPTTQNDVSMTMISVP